jgi:uncharacterized protein YehS (DUF1456 family)
MLDNSDIIKLSEVFATKDDLKDFLKKGDFDEFKNQSLSNQDKILGKLDTLLQEKTVKDEQDKRKTNVLKIHDNALRRGKILLGGEAAEIDKLRVF